MQTTDQRPAIALCLLLSMFAMYAGFVCIRIAAGHDVRPDLAVWAILTACVLLGASAARNASLRARASRARENGGLGASAYGRLGDDPVGTDEQLQAYVAMAWLRRRATEISEAEWEEQRALRDAPTTRSFMGVDDDPGLENWEPTARLMAEVRRAETEFAARKRGLTAHKDVPPHFPNTNDALDRLLIAAEAPDSRGEAAISAAHIATAAHDYGDDSPYVKHLRGEFVESDGDDEASIVTPACNGDELLCEMMQELDDMLGDAVDDPDGIAPESWRTIGRVWRDICIAHGIDQPTYMHRDPDHWDATPEHDYDDAIEAAGPAMHEAAGG